MKTKQTLATGVNCSRAFLLQIQRNQEMKKTNLHYARRMVPEELQSVVVDHNVGLLSEVQILAAFTQVLTAMIIGLVAYSWMAIQLLYQLVRLSGLCICCIQPPLSLLSISIA